MFETVNVPILGIIENMSYFVCDNCHKKHFIFGGNENDVLQERFGLETLAQLPLLPDLSGKLDHQIDNSYIKEATDRVIRAIGKNRLVQKQKPTIQFDEKQIILQWADGKLWRVNNRNLRLSCRCAFCVDETTGTKLLKPENVREDIIPKEIVTLGNYALGIKWNDGHASGIYPYKTIEALAKDEKVKV